MTSEIEFINIGDIFESEDGAVRISILDIYIDMVLHAPLTVIKFGHSATDKESFISADRFATQIVAGWRKIQRVGAARATQ